MSSRIISGNRTADEIARRYLAKIGKESERKEDKPKDKQHKKSKPKVAVNFPAQQPTPPVPVIPVSAGPFYRIEKARLIQATTPAYRQFLKDAKYGDIDSCNGLEVAKGILKWSPEVRDLAGRLRLKYNKQSLTGNDGEYVVNINQTDGRRLVNGLGYNLLPTGLMYPVFIPYILELIKQGNAEAQVTLKEMTDIKAEWLEDIILGKSKVKVGSRVQKGVNISRTDGRFDRTSLNEFGYPPNIQDSGEHYFLAPTERTNAVFRNRGSDLFLNCYWGPSVVDVSLGVRVAKFF